MTVPRILDKAISGERIDGAEIERLFAHRDLLELGQAADAVRRRKTDAGAAS